MAYRFVIAESVESAARRSAGERIDKAIGRLAHESASDPVEAVHGARKDLKKARSLLRLVRPGLGGKAYRRENRALRAVGRSLSGVRDADVMLEATDALAERYPGQVPGTTFDALKARLRTDAAVARATATPADALAELERVRARVDRWPLEVADWSIAADGIARSYRRGRDAFALVQEYPTVERVHEWRKRVKDLWYQQRLLRDLWEPVLKAEAREAHELSRLLGDDHDLALLRARIVDDSGVQADLEPVMELVDRRRDELREQATQLGHRIYAERPKAFARRMRAYATAADAEQAQGGQARDVASLQGGRVA